MMVFQKEDFILKTIQRSRLWIDMLQHHQKVFVAHSQYWWAIKHHIIDVDFRLQISEEIYGVENAGCYDCTC